MFGILSFVLTHTHISVYLCDTLTRHAYPFSRGFKAPAVVPAVYRGFFSVTYLIFYLSYATEIGGFIVMG